MKTYTIITLLCSLIFFSCSNELNEIKPDADFGLNTDKTCGEFIGEFTGLEFGMWTSIKFKNGKGDTISILAFDEAYYKELLNDEGTSYVKTKKDNSILDSILTKPESFIGKVYRVNWVTVFFTPNLEEVPSNGPLNSVFSVARLNNDENPKQQTNITEEQLKESTELVNGTLKITSQGKTLLVHKPYAVTHFCTANFEQLRIGEYSDWRLPTPEELKLIYKYRELLGLNTNTNMNAYDVSELLGEGRRHPVTEVWSSEYNEDKIKKTEQEYKHHYGGGGDYYDKTSEKTLYNVTTLNIITGEIKTHNGCECGSVGDDAIWIPVRSGN